MLFNSIDFLVFFPIVVSIFFVIPSKLRCAWLLVASYYFYMSWNPKYALLIALSTVITYLSGILIERCAKAGHKKLVVAGSLISNLMILAVFKYVNFGLHTIGIFLNSFGIQFTEKKLDLLLPVGISFYTFQALSYTLDVYREKITAEKNIVRYALFVSFFPQLVAGPIERSGNLLRQIQAVDKAKLWNYSRIKEGILLMLWGLFQKLVIADRAAILVNQVYYNYLDYGFLEITIATILFAFRIYCDFGGYTNIARGAARVMGFELMQNFRQPYLACNIKDFWKRWHISLTSWFTDYLYIPLGGNRKGDLRKYVNIMIVFAVSGLWHGASWNFIVWGVLHGLYQVIGNIVMRVKEKIAITPLCSEMSFSRRLGKRIVTFCLVDFAWIFFAAYSLNHAVSLLGQMFVTFQTTSIYELGLNRGNWFILCFALAILGIVDAFHEKGKSLFLLVEKQTIWFRWLLYLGLLWVTIMFGIYGVGYDTSQFIYFQF